MNRMSSRPGTKVMDISSPSVGCSPVDADVESESHNFANPIVKYIGATISFSESIYRVTLSSAACCQRTLPDTVLSVLGPGSTSVTET